jgi:hypothetical protein
MRCEPLADWRKYDMSMLSMARKKTIPIQHFTKCLPRSAANWFALTRHPAIRQLSVLVFLFHSLTLQNLLEIR